MYKIINDNNIIINPELKKEYYNKYKSSLNLTISTISYIRGDITNKYKNCDSLSLGNKIEINNFNMKSYVMDLKYNYKNSKKLIERKQRIIIFGWKENLSLLDEQMTEEFFIDTSFKIIPAELHPHKLTIFAGISKNLNKPILICFLLIKYLDDNTYDKIF